MRESPSARHGQGGRSPAAARHDPAPDGSAWPAHPPDPLAAAVARRQRPGTATPKTTRARQTSATGPASGTLPTRAPAPAPPASPTPPATPTRAATPTPPAATALPAASTAEPRPSAWHRWRAVALPLLTLAAVMGVEVSNRTWTYIGYTVLVPMVAANLAGPRLTSLFAGLALAAGGFSVWWEHLWDPAHGGLPALTARLAGILVGGAMAVLASRYNTRRETKLANITQVAEAAQRAILSDLPAISATGLRLAVRYESAATEAMVGGDLYEMVDSPWGTRLLLGDARGKGLDAVRLASRVLGCFRVVARARPDVGLIVADLDSEVRSAAGLDDFVTGIAVEIGPDRLTLVNAGHPDPVLCRDGHVRLLAPPERQPPLGLGAAAVGALTVRLRPGDRLLLYTDGIAEARDRAGAFFPLLTAAGRELGRAGSLEQALERLVRTVQDWTGHGLRDDMALLAVEVPPALDPSRDRSDAGGRRRR